MKTLIQKLPLNHASSFVARTYQTPYFETPWHQHTEIELALIRESGGTAFIGDALIEYHPDDVYLLGENLPHWFRKADTSAVGSSMVVHFTKDFWGRAFLDLPELNAIKTLLDVSVQGLRLRGELRWRVAEQLRIIEQQQGFTQLATLLDCLHLISQSGEYTRINQSPVLTYSTTDQAQIHTVLEYTMTYFQQKIRLEEVAALTHRSVSAFCQYFRKSTKKSYVQFLTEIRLAHACKLLTTTSLPVTQICFDSGFHNWANFSKHFKQQLGMAPSQYRRQYSAPQLPEG